MSHPMTMDMIVDLILLGLLILTNVVSIVALYRTNILPKVEKIDKLIELVERLEKEK